MALDDLKQKVLKAVEETGFPLELRVSRLLQQHDCLVANNVYYLDPDEGKGREVDIRALKNVEFSHSNRTFYVRNCYFIECKRSRKRPWVVFTSESTGYDSNLPTLQVRGLSYKDVYASALNTWASEEVLEALETVHPYAKNRMRGRGYLEALKGGSPDMGGEFASMIFKAITTAVKAAIIARDQQFAARGNSVCFYYPFIVLDGVLFEAFLEGDEVRLEERDQVIVSFFYVSPKHQDERLLVPIVTEPALSSFLVALQDSLEIIAGPFKNNPKLFQLN
jgi:hypothetical protein